MKRDKGLLLLLLTTTAASRQYYSSSAYTIPSSPSFRYRRQQTSTETVLLRGTSSLQVDCYDRTSSGTDDNSHGKNNDDRRIRPNNNSRISNELELSTAILSQPSRRDAIESLVSTCCSSVLLAFPKTALAAASNEAITSSAATTGGLPIPPQTRYTSWPLGKVAFSLLPLAGSYTRRATVTDEVIKDTIWTMDQIQGVVNVNVPVRMTVIKVSVFVCVHAVLEQKSWCVFLLLEKQQYAHLMLTEKHLQQQLSPAAGGGLFIHNPLAPTPQLLQQIRSLEQLHGPVRHIVLGTVALEHKATFGPFAQYFSTATLWIQPGQWSFPLQLPIEFLGVTQSGDQVRILPSSQFIHGEKTLEEEIDNIEPQRYRAAAKRSNPPTPEWTTDIDYETLGPLKFQSVGAYSETAFYHKSTQTLIVTDCVCSVTKDPPKVITEDPRALLYHARDSISDVVVDDIETRRKGWRRMVQFGLVFFPSQIEVVPLVKAIRQSLNVDPKMKSLGVGAVPGGTLYPWTWHDNDVDLVNFNAISENGKLFCPPILTKLILDREPRRTLEWVDRITKRFNSFTHVIPGHLNNYVKSSPKEFSEAFDPLRSNPRGGKVYSQRALAVDLSLLQEASDLLTQFGVVAQSQVCDLEPARSVGRFASIAPK